MEQLIQNDIYEDLDLYNDADLYQALMQEVEAKRVRMYKHNELPLVGFDYSEVCKFEKAWNKVNSIARGLVFEVLEKDKGIVIVKRLNNPLPKFENIEETKLTLKDIKDEIESITDKEDGSCIITFLYWGIRIFMTRGSFHSPQAQLAETLWPKGTSILEFADCTCIFELVGPSNKNVNRTKYDKDELILLCVRNNQDFNDEAPQEFIDNIVFYLSDEEKFSEFKFRQPENFLTMKNRF